MMQRRVIEVGGIVQGVGFRPFVHGLATSLGLHGHVRNEGGGVRIEIEGPVEELDRFTHELGAHPPTLARIERLHWTVRPIRGEQGFSIVQSCASDQGPVFISPDVATCDACLRELFDPADRRYRYPFINCTHCGPRLTIITGAPYDRARTTMAGFAMCDACRAEYENPADRRFHAQPVACPICGPRISFDTGDGRAQGEDALVMLVQSLRRGKIAAIKGLGGYHLACDASNENVVSELRRRKHRYEKPLAVMTADLAAARSICDINDLEHGLLTSPARPIVLLQKRSSPESAIAASVAPHNPFVGVMLPYTPLHHLLMHGLAGLPLVMTSGNRSDEPIAYVDDDALARLKGIADVFLTHDRPIHVRCDDSVTRVVLGQELPVRRSRGYAPGPVKLPQPCRIPLLAVGGQLKSVFALAQGDQAFLGQHMGDLDDYEAFKAFVRDIDLDQELLSISPRCIVHDLHPEYASTRYALKRAAAENLDVIAVQHHHAHMASCMAENNLAGPVIGISFDGTGYGSDGGIWGGEILVGDYRDFTRAAHLRYVRMPGGEQAIRQPWRMAAAHLLDAGYDLELLRDRIDAQSLKMITLMVERGIRSPLTSSMGRLFDAAAALIGVRDTVAYEGQAAVELEMLAVEEEPAAPVEAYPFDWTAPASWHRLPAHESARETSSTLDPANAGVAHRSEGLPGQAIHGIEIDSRPLVRALVHDIRQNQPQAMMARRFHETVARIALEACQRIRAAGGPIDVTLSGGVFLNHLLTRRASLLLAENGFKVHYHHQVPPNDGGLCLGQAAVAAARLQQ